jgi:hypothetical protein
MTVSAYYKDENQNEVRKNLGGIIFDSMFYEFQGRVNFNCTTINLCDAFALLLENMVQKELFTIQEINKILSLSYPLTRIEKD